MTTILKAADKGELLTAISTLVGYTPTESLVVAPFRGTRSRGALRVDLPTATDADTLAAVAAQTLGMVCRLGGITMIAAAIYTDGDHARHALLAETLRTASDLLGLDVAAIFYATPNAWGEYFTGEAHTEPAPALPGAPAIAAGDQHAGIELPATDPALAAAVASAVFPTDDEATLTALLEDVLTADLTAPDSSTLAHLAAVMAVPAVRDAALIQWASDEQTGREAVAAQTAHTTAGTPFPEHLGRIYLGDTMQRPDLDRLAAALKVCRFTAAHVTGREHAALLAAAAWLSWALGRTTHAVHLLDHARQADPGLTLVDTLDAVMTAGVLPAWVFTR
ncbi:DUF4192 family protein [Microbacterium sp. B2969]|uniref:DUF4192 family protein n=1 Tax=Microbacterium alkaliflavum TaxID=3248839 RepID=A0ABW7QEE6_9MICO